MSEIKDPIVEYIYRKGGTVLITNGHQYYKLKEYKNGSVIWRCTMYYKKLKCSGSLTLKGTDIVRTIPHVCKPDFTRNKIAVSLSKLKAKATKTDKPLPKLYDNSFKKFIIDEGNNSAQNFPSFTTVKNSLYNIRNKSALVDKTVFTNLIDVQVPAQFYHMILADYFYEGNRIILFCTPDARQMINNVTEYFVDATFKACPPPFKELVSIHGDIGSTSEKTKVLPIIFALLSNKSQSSYEIMYSIIKSELANFKPTLIHCDFEIANINALLITFPSIQIVGCYYHWRRCLWRKAEVLLGKSRPKAENRIISLCAVLPLLPSEMIQEGWTYIKTESQHLSIEKFLKYVQRSWMKNKYITLLSVFGMRHRTNNVLEGYHSKLNKIINKNNKTLMRLLNAIKDDSLIKTIAKQCNKRRTAHIKNDEHIQHIQLQLLNNEISVGYALEKLR